MRSLYDAKSWLIGKDRDAGKDWSQEEKRKTGDEMVRWHYQLEGHEFEEAPGVGDGKGSLVCWSPYGHKVLDLTEWLNWCHQNPETIPWFWFSKVILKKCFQKLQKSLKRPLSLSSDPQTVGCMLSYVGLGTLESAKNQASISKIILLMKSLSITSLQYGSGILSCCVSKIFV